MLSGKGYAMLQAGILTMLSSLLGGRQEMPGQAAWGLTF